MIPPYIHINISQLINREVNDFILYSDQYFAVT